MGQIISTEEAARMAARFLRSVQPSSSPEMKLLENLTEEHDFGWVFFWGPVDDNVLVGGNAPLIVSRSDGSVHVTGTAHPIERYIESFAHVRRTYPFAEARYLVTLDGWLPGLQKISLTKLIRHFSTLDLARAKQCTDDILANRKVELTFQTQEQAGEFLSQAKSLGSLGYITERWE